MLLAKIVETSARVSLTSAGWQRMRWPPAQTGTNESASPSLAVGSVRNRGSASVGGARRVRRASNQQRSRC
jgi:hypothetical protein